MYLKFIDGFNSLKLQKEKCHKIVHHLIIQINFSFINFNKKQQLDKSQGHQINLFYNIRTSHRQLKMARRNNHPAYQVPLSRVAPQEAIMSINSINDQDISDGPRSIDKTNKVNPHNLVQTIKNVQSDQDKQIKYIEKPHAWSQGDPIFRQGNQLIVKPDKQQQKGQLKEGQYTFANGDTYMGEWKDKWVHGYGVYTFSKKNLQYRGQFKKSQQHGNGTLLRIPSGQQKEEVIYDGQWKNGEKDGRGKYYYYKDTFYDGNWIKNIKEGQGTFKSPEGEYVGAWKNDKKNGDGILRLKNGNIFDGKWKDDSFEQGTLTYSNGDKYDGQFKNFLRHGHGAYTYSNKTIYKGYWQNNNKTGSGEIKYFNGDIFQGNMKEGKREGPDCQYNWKTGQNIYAQFKNDLPTHGKILPSQGGQSEFDLSK